MKKILVTGGCGFIGSNFIEYLYRKYDCQIVNVDRLSIGSNPANISPEIKKSKRYSFYAIDIATVNVERVFHDHLDIDAIVNFAAETHVDRSLTNRLSFVNSNIAGTQNLLDLTKEFKVGRFLQVSTDEVYGEVLMGESKEGDEINPTNPYSATKVGAEAMVKASINSFGVDAVITRSSNNYGPKQFTEKLIPMIISKALAGEQIKVFNGGTAIREWTHVWDNCIAIDLVLRGARSGEVYNIGSGERLCNTVIVERILKILGAPKGLIVNTNDRINDDNRYALSSHKIRDEFGWKPTISLQAGLESTVEWYKQNIK